MTRKEYEAEFGVKPVVSQPLPEELKPAPRVMTRAEYQREFFPITGKTTTEKIFASPPGSDFGIGKVTGKLNEINPLYQIPKAFIEGSVQTGEGFGKILTAKSPSEAGKGALEAISGAGKAAFSPVIGTIESVTNLPGLHFVKSFLWGTDPEFKDKYGIAPLPELIGDKVSDIKPIQDLMLKYQDSPEVAEDLIGTVLTISGLRAAKPKLKTELQAEWQQAYDKATRATIGTPPTEGTTGTGLRGYLTESGATKNAKITQNIADDLITIKYGVARKSITPAQLEKDTASASRLAETDALVGSVNSQGTIDPLLINDAVKRYRFLREGDIDRSLVKNRLEEETRATNAATATNLAEITTKLTEAANRFTGSFRDRLDNAIASEIRGLRKMQIDELGRIKLEDIQQAKINETQSLSGDYGKLSSNVKEWKKAKARVYKEIIEQNSRVKVVVNGKPYKIKDINAELGKVEQDIAFLRSLSGRKVEGGRLGKYFASISGNLIGYAAGSMFGVVGGAIGAAIGGEVARGIKGAQFQRTFGKDRGLITEKNKILQAANKPLNVDPLRTPDPVIGLPKDIPKTKDILKTERQIRENVEAQKKAIKKGDFGLVATLKEIYKLLVQHLNNLIQKIKETPNKQGGFAKNPLAENPSAENQSRNNLGNRNMQYSNSKNATTNAISGNSTTLGQKIQSTGEQKPTIKLKRDVTITTLSGEKVTIPEDEVLKAYESGGKALLKDGREYIVSKSQYENIKNNSLKSEAKEFAPELKGTEDVIKGQKLTKQRDLTVTEEKELRDLLTEGRQVSGFYNTPEGLRAEELQRIKGTFETSESQTKFSQYQLPNGKNYKEILIKANPEIAGLPKELHATFADVHNYKTVDEFLNAKFIKGEGNSWCI